MEQIRTTGRKRTGHRPTEIGFGDSIKRTGRQPPEIGLEKIHGRWKRPVGQRK